MRLPQHFPSDASGPVSGLASFDLPPSHADAQWPDDKSALTYRCGGSAGITPASRLTA